MTPPLEFPDLETLWNVDQLEVTEGRLRELLADAAGPAADPSYRVELLTQLARAQGVQGRLPEARLTLKEAEAKLADPSAVHRTRAKIRCLLESGRLCVLEKTPSQARPLFLEAWQSASNAGEDFFAIEAAQMLAVIEPQKQQKEWTVKALALAESSPQPEARGKRGALFTSLGWAEFHVRNYEQALEFFKKALSCTKAESNPKKAVLSRWAVAKALRALNRVEEALEIQNDVLAELTRLDVKDGYVYEELAECLQFLKKTAEAQSYFELAYRELSKDEWFADNRAPRLKRLKEMGKVK